MMQTPTTTRRLEDLGASYLPDVAAEDLCLREVELVRSSVYRVVLNSSQDIESCLLKA
ncbi:hypothetical protein P3H78_19225 [Streptomyces sp. K1PA1]|uniref:Uncharacterized protein n=1 Tax=Streptomyces tropicalis TaxID=3034234 RepID=A0ABT6A7T9_9ACTN|nr:hypothetical protein [Streptomyces tropicalis]MDF3300718.1 hypothetical protein [Streptomyces tropicalis]